MTSKITTFTGYLFRAFPLFLITSVVLLVFWSVFINSKSDSKSSRQLAVELLQSRYRNNKVRYDVLIPLGIVMLGMFVAWSVVSQDILPPEMIAVIGYCVGIVISSIKGIRIKQSMDMKSVLTISSFLFLATVVSASGILTTLAAFLQNSIPNPKVLLIVIMLITSLVSGFVSAGPAAAAMLPVIVNLCNTTLAAQSGWVAIAYAASICAGSSLFLWSATAGFILSGKIDGANLECNNEKVNWGIKEYIKYADDGISGTNTKKREEFNHMIDDCKAGNIDMIITKSISRFARNTLDCLKYIRQLKDMNIPVLFEKESINTMDAKGEVLITIMASLAQQESQSLSQNVKLGLQYRYQQGKVQINHNRFLGYTKDADGNLIIDPEQAEIVKRIYREYLEGLSMDKIAAGLERDGILTGAGGKRWHTSTINKILRNEKYIGDALLQKTYTTDFLNKTRVKNNGLVPQYYVEGNHEAIIPKEIYLQVQEELVRRRVVKTSANGKKRSYSCNHCFSQIIICGDCGEMFRRIHWNNRGCKSIVWRCISKLEPTGLECHARTIHELDLQEIVLTALNELLGDKSKYQKQLQQNIAQVIRASAAITTDGIDEKLMELQQELVKKANNKEAYDEIADQIFALREKRQQASMDTVQRDEQLQRITELQDFIKDQSSDLTVFDEALVKRWLKQITIWDDHCTVELKSGLKVDVER